MYKTIEKVPKLYKLLNDYKKSQKEIQDYLNNLQPYKKNLDENYKCPGDKTQCGLSHACNDCPYNKEIMYPPILSDLKLSDRDMGDFNERLEEELEEK